MGHYLSMELLVIFDVEERKMTVILVEDKECIFDLVVTLLGTRHCSRYCFHRFTNRGCIFVFLDQIEM